MARRSPHPFRVAGLAMLGLLFATTLLADSDDCAVPMADWQPRSAVTSMARQHGWTVRRIKISDGCYKIYAQDDAGRMVEIKVNPATLDILEVEIEHGSDDDDSAGQDLGSTSEHD